jgi:SAM-dependent methyltransferase
MADFDFAKFYNDQLDYEAFRNDPEKRIEYDTAVNWKVNNLSSLVAGGTVFKNVLEIGCAFGVLLNKVADRLSVNDRTGLDISSENINTARLLFPKCNFIIGTIDDQQSALTVSDGEKKFDLVILSDIVEHIPDDNDFMKKVSGFSSYALLNLPLEKCYRNRNRKYGVDDPSGHLRKYNRKDATRLAGSNGFSVVDSFISNAHCDREFFKIYRRNRMLRVKKKNFPKKVFWIVAYSLLDGIKIISPWIYLKIFGSNYFALLKSV